MSKKNLEKAKQLVDEIVDLAKQIGELRKLEETSDVEQSTLFLVGIGFDLSGYTDDEIVQEARWQASKAKPKIEESEAKRFDHLSHVTRRLSKTEKAEFMESLGAWNDKGWILDGADLEEMGLD